MSEVMEEEIKRWMARRKSALVRGQSHVRGLRFRRGPSAINAFSPCRQICIGFSKPHLA